MQQLLLVVFALAVLALGYALRASGRASRKPVALRPGVPLVLPLVSRTALSPDTRLLRFALPALHVLGLPVGQHVMVTSAGPGEEVSRPYTPVRYAAAARCFVARDAADPRGAARTTTSALWSCW